MLDYITAALLIVPIANVIAALLAVTDKDMEGY